MIWNFTPARPLFVSVACCLPAALAFAGPAHAQGEDRAETDGWYLAGAGTVSLLDDAPIDIAVPEIPIPGGVIKTKFAVNTGYGIQVAVGRRFGSFRLEGEAGYTANHSDHYTAIIPPTGRIASDGEHNALRLMANGYVDLGHGAIQPYFGGGIGWTRAHNRIIAPRAPFPTEAPMRLIDDHTNAFAWQLMAGAAVRLSPRLALTAQYRRFDAGEILGKDTVNHNFSSRYAGHNIDLGLRVRF
jgi:opacity protein-like surface antigen